MLGIGHIMDTPNNTYEAAEYVAKRLGLPPQFVIKLLDEDDWSFIVKAHALVEASVMQAIKHRLSGHSISKFLGKLTMRRLLDFAKDLDALDSQLCSKIRLLSEIRNDIVHDVTKVSFSFAQYLSDQQKRNGFQGLFLNGVSGCVDIAGHSVGRKQFLIDNPKLAVMFFLIELLVEVYLEESKAMSKLVHQELGDSLLKILNRPVPN